jgi:hypothetical protein
MLRATHLALREWAEKRREPWHGAMEATLFQRYDFLGLVEWERDSKGFRNG